MYCPDCGSASLRSRILRARPPVRGERPSFDYQTRTSWHLVWCRQCPARWVGGMVRRGQLRFGAMTLQSGTRTRVPETSKH
jgi:hypothetical protein